VTQQAAGGSLVPASGSSRLAGVLGGHVSGELGRRRQQIEWGRMVDLGEGVMGLMPDTWTAQAFAPGVYLVVEPLLLGHIRTEEVEVPEQQVAGGGHGGHQGGGGDHDHGVHEHGLHRHPHEYPILALAIGDRVLVCWLGPTPVVIGRVR
jgi:hypothetical protein